MKHEQIRGRPVIHEFIILHEGWEFDNYGWVTDDGKLWTTCHSTTPSEMSLDSLMQVIEYTNESLNSLNKAMEIVRGETT